MGYIGPIPRYQFDPYSNRIKTYSKSHRNAIPVSKIKKVNHIQGSKNIDDRIQQRRENEDEQASYGMLAELTGKGIYIDEKI